MSAAVPIFERARSYLARMPVGVSGQNRHAATFHAAVVLMNGFGLGEAEALPLLEEFNARCLPPSDPRKLLHRLRRAAACGDKRGRGYLLRAGTRFPSRAEQQLSKLAGLPAVEVKPRFEAEYLSRLAAPWRHVDLLWLADRSAVDPALVSRGRFLELLYRPGEMVKIFTRDKSQGQALWPCAESAIPESGPLGVWFLAAPVDGRSYPNPRKAPKADGTAHMSSRAEESVTSWRWMMVESDEAPTRDWLGAIVQLPLRIAALYTSGGRSVHALIRVDARSKPEWDALKAEMKPWLVTLGADPGALSAVRLTRLPGCWRRGRLKVIKREGQAPIEEIVSLCTERSPRGALQKLLYVNPEPQLRPLIELPRMRDVEKIWLDHAAAGVADGDVTGGEWLKQGLGYYARASERIREALQALSQREID